jgi:hypothetical protein
MVGLVIIANASLALIPANLGLGLGIALCAAGRQLSDRTVSDGDDF